MIVQAPDPAIRTIDDYDISFTNGSLLPLCLDKELGDTIEFEGDDAIVVKLVEKPSPLSPTLKVAAEEITIFTKHVLAIYHKQRKSTDMTPAQRAELEKTYQEMTTRTAH